MRLALLVITGLLASGPACAQDLRDFCAERPGKATPACVLDKGHLQLEVGLADVVFSRGRAQHEDTYTLGAAEVRLGVTRRVEVEAGWSPLIIDRARGAGTRTGAGDAVLGVRAALTDPDGKATAVSAQAFVTVPTATEGMGAGGWTGGVRLPVSIPLSSNAGLALTPEIDLMRDGAGHGTHLAWTGAAGVSRTFGTLSLGAELWGQIDDDPAGRTRQASADLTAALALGADSQLDAGVNLGLNHDTPDVEIYAGLARRF